MIIAGFRTSARLADAAPSVLAILDARRLAGVAPLPGKALSHVDRPVEKGKDSGHRTAEDSTNPLVASPHQPAADRR